MVAIFVVEMPCNVDIPCLCFIMHFSTFWRDLFSIKCHIYMTRMYKTVCLYVSQYWTLISIHTLERWITMECLITYVYIYIYIDITKMVIVRHYDKYVLYELYASESGARKCFDK